MPFHFEASTDHQTWRFNGYEITQVCVDAAGVRLQAWTSTGGLDVRIGGPFALRTAGGEMQFDAERPRELGPVFGLLRLPLHSLTALRSGALELRLGNEQTVAVEPDPTYEAWEAYGTGELAKLGYLCGPGGGSPWG